MSIILADSHCHLNMLDLTPYGGQLDRVLLDAKENHVSYFLCVSVDLKTFPAVLEIARQHDTIFASVGVHPNEKEEVWDETTLIQLGQDPKVVAVGETGLDYYRSEGELEWQRDHFRQHIRAAKALKKPLIIHTRDAKADTIKIMQEENARDVGGVMHCFTEDWAMAKSALDMGFMISISGIVTFKSATQIQEVAKRVPIESLLIETDAPFLAPVPHRGKPNVPAYVRHTAEFIANLRDISLSELARQTTRNFLNMIK